MEKPKNNPLVEPWNTPFNTPPFEEIKEEHYLPAFQYAFAQAKDELYRIKAVKMKPTFANTVEALDRSGRLLNDISGIFFNLLEANTSENMQKIAQEISPALTAFYNDLYLDPALFARVKAVYENPGDLSPEQKMLLEKTYKAFVRQGANLSDTDKEKFRDYSMRLSSLSLQFGQNVLSAVNNQGNLLLLCYQGKLTPETLRAFFEGMIADIPTGISLVAENDLWRAAEGLKDWFEAVEKKSNFHITYRPTATVPQKF